MSMLDEADRSKYFPFVSLRGDALSGAILNAELQANSAAGRNLELTQYVEFIQTFSPLVTLRYYPVVESRTMRVEAVYEYVVSSSRPFSRSFLAENESLKYSEVTADTVFTDIDCSQYQVDKDGLLRISSTLVGSWLRITYWAGFDFTSEAIEVQQLKSAVAAILNYEAAK